MVANLDNGNNRVREFTNSVLCNHNKNLQRDGIQREKLSDLSYQNKYLKAPLTAISELREYLSSAAKEYDVKVSTKPGNIPTDSNIQNNSLLTSMECVPVQTSSGNVEEDDEFQEEMLWNENIIDDPEGQHESLKQDIVDSGANPEGHNELAQDHLVNEVPGCSSKEFSNTYKHTEAICDSLSLIPSSLIDNEQNTHKHTEARCDSPSLIPSVEDLHKMLQLKFKQSNRSVSIFTKMKKVTEIAKTLVKFHEDYRHIILEATQHSTIILYPCKGPRCELPQECQFYSISAREYQGGLSCITCRTTSYQVKKTQNRIVVSPSRKRPFTSLSPDDQYKAYKKANNDNKILSKSLTRLKQKLSSSEEKLVFEKESIARNQLCNAIEYIKSNWDK